MVMNPTLPELIVLFFCDSYSTTTLHGGDPENGHLWEIKYLLKYEIIFDRKVSREKIL